MKSALTHCLIFYWALCISCVEIESQPPQIPEAAEHSLGTLEINIAVGESITRSTESSDYECGITSLQCLVFSSSGNIIAYQSLSSTETSTTLELKYGMVQVYVVANLPQPLKAIRTIDQLKATTVFLGQNTLNEKGGFIMRGITTALVAKEATGSATVKLERLLSRIYVRDITNSCPEELGDIVLKSVFLANVVGNQNINGTAAPATWYNQCGCKGGIEGQEIDGVRYTAEVPVMTFRSVNKTIANGQSERIAASVYGFENTSTSSSTEFPFSARASRLHFIFSQKNLETGEYEDKTCSIALENAMIANHTYSVDFNIYGTISDPDLQIALEVTSCNVTGWSTAASGSLNI